MGNTRPLGMASARLPRTTSWCSHCGAGLPTPTGASSSVRCVLCHRVTRIERGRSMGGNTLAPPSPPRLASVRHEVPAGYPMVRGRKRALLVGVSYKGTDCELKGTVNDVDGMRRLLCEKFGFPSDCILVLTGNRRTQEVSIL